MDERADRAETLDSSEVYVLSDRAETFLLGGRMKPPGSDVECDVEGRLVKTFLLLGENGAGFGSAVPARDAGLRGLMKP